jgi:hypothetical protein
MSNFDFLEKIDSDLYQIISDAEKLYRDEYFEQSVVQTRRFAESVCRKLLGERALPDSTFDDCLSTLQDMFTKNIRQRELINDLYFLKSQGNTYAHQSKVKQDGNIALDCIKRAFEVGINYAMANGASPKTEKLEFSEEVLVMGEKKKKSTLKEKYLAKKKTTRKNNQLYKKKKEQAKKYVYPSLVENKKSATKMNFIGGLVILLSVALYIYITFFVK